ncbi:MAG: DUF3311 domain-containing protein [Alphaproteobacteria bacterium]|nr:DUF3311 domain-containing protein [Alphaproteobacteria bacterium]
MARKVFYAFLLLIPCVAVLWTPFYNRVTPEIVGIPFFYWYQLLWIPIGSALLLVLNCLWRAEH